MNALKSVILAILVFLVITAAVIYGLSRGYEKPEEPLPPPGGDSMPVQTDEREVVNDAPRLAAPDDGEGLSRDKHGWGLGAAKDAQGRPLDAVDAQSKYSDLGGVFVFPEDEKAIYLTFDLGYENGYTSTILDTLARHGVKGTFFITREYADDAPEVVERIIKEGHTLGNHTAKHPSMPDVSDERQRDEIMSLHEYIKDKYGYEMTLFRYPMGEYSEHSLSLVNGLGYKSIFWSFAYKDWLTDAQPDAASSLARVSDALHPGAIYLLHAVSSTNDAIMGDFITQAREKGYDFALIDEKLGTAQKRVESPLITGSVMD